jgi:hypothetical protein
MKRQDSVKGAINQMQVMRDYANRQSQCAAQANQCAHQGDAMSKIE